MSWDLDHVRVQSSAGGPGGGGRDRKESAGGLRPQLHQGVGERKEEAMETQGEPESREHPQRSSGIWPCGPVHSDPQGGTGAQEEVLCGPRKTKTELSAATHLPSQVGTRAPMRPHLSPRQTQDTVVQLGASFQTQPENRTGLCAQMGEEPVGLGRSWAARRKLVMEPTVTWRGARERA